MQKSIILLISALCLANAAAVSSPAASGFASVSSPAASGAKAVPSNSAVSGGKSVPAPEVKPEQFYGLHHVSGPQAASLETDGKAKPAYNDGDDYF